MNKSRLDPTAHDAQQRGGAPDELPEDLLALHRETSRELPPLEHFVRAASRRPRTLENLLMATSDNLTRRPLGIAALAGALAVIALLVIPFSYERTTGHTITLALQGGALDAEHLKGIALQMKKLTKAPAVAVQADNSNGALAFTLTSTVSNASGIDADATAKGFAAELTRLGYSASTTVAPVKERVSGSVYAYARDRVINVNVEGKSAAQIENEIRQGLADAGVTNALVSVSKDGSGADEKLKLTVEAQKQLHDPGDAAASEPIPKFVFNKGGAPIGAAGGFTVREEMRRTPDGATLTLIVQDTGKSATIEVQHADTVGDAVITAQVESQLRAAGIDATVTTTDGRVHISKN